MNEYKWAENAIKEKHLSSKPYETIVRIAKYHMYNGKSKKEIRGLIENFLLSCDKSISIVSWGKRIDSAISFAEKKPICIVDSICVTTGELDKIKEIQNIQDQRLAFTLLCISKFNMASSQQTNYWVSTPDNEIMRMANINTSIKRQSAMFSHLKDIGLIKFSSQVDNLSVQVLFADDKDTAMYITDFRNLGYQYMNYINGGYYFCENCGVICKCNKHSCKKQRYCPDCAIKIHTRQKVESVMRKRNETANVDICKVS